MVVQTDAIDPAHPSVIVCQLTSVLVDAPDLRVTIEPSLRNGLTTRSQIMVDKPVTIRRHRVGRIIGQLERDTLAALNRSLAFVTGLAD